VAGDFEAAPDPDPSEVEVPADERFEACADAERAALPVAARLVEE